MDTYPGRIPRVSVSDTYPIRDTHAPCRIRVLEVVDRSTRSPRTHSSARSPTRCLPGDMLRQQLGEAMAGETGWTHTRSSEENRSANGIVPPGLGPYVMAIKASRYCLVHIPCLFFCDKERALLITQKYGITIMSN